MRLVETRGDEVPGRIAGDVGQWEALRARLGQGPFLSAAWMEVYARHPPAGTIPLLLEARRGDELAGALVLAEERRRIAGLPARILRSLSDDHSQRYDALLDSEEAADALLAHLVARPAWDVIELRELTSEARANLLVDAARRAGWPIASWDSSRSPFLPLAGSAKDLVAGLSSRFRSNLRRRFARAEDEIGDVSLERIPDDPGAILAALEEGFRLEAAGWKGDAGTAILCDPALRSRYTALAFALSRAGLLALSFLRVGGRRLAFHFAAEENGVYYLFKQGHDPGYSRFGTGQLLVGAAAGDLATRGGRELDFLGDEMPWKMEWTSEVRPHRWAYLFRPTAYGRALHAAKFRVIPAARRWLARPAVKR